MLEENKKQGKERIVKERERERQRGILASWYSNLTSTATYIPKAPCPMAKS
jgi:hypothetical protein